MAGTVRRVNGMITTPARGPNQRSVAGFRFLGMTAALFSTLLAASPKLLEAGRGLGNPPTLTFREASLSNIYSNTTTTTDDDSDTFLIDSDPTTINDPDRLLGHYREVLKGLWRKTVTDILETGRVFAEAQGRLLPSHYKALMVEFGFEKTMVSRLRTIYGCLKNVANSQHLKLPASVSTLLEMTKVGPELLETKADEGSVVNNNYPGRYSTTQTQGAEAGAITRQSNATVL